MMMFHINDSKRDVLYSINLESIDYIEFKKHRILTGFDRIVVHFKNKKTLDIFCSDPHEAFDSFYDALVADASKQKKENA